MKTFAASCWQVATARADPEMLASNPVDTSPLTNGAAGDILAVKGVTVRFGGVVANDDVSLTCAESRVTALLGPNGAGKSTLFDVITGARRPTQGTVTFAGRDISHLTPERRARLGVARTFQNLAVSPELTVLDNVVLGAARFRSYGPVRALLRSPEVRRNDRALSRIAAQTLKLLGLGDVADIPARGLPYGSLRRLEIARALALGPTLLLMDEPAAGMDRAESSELARAILAVKEAWDLSVLVVEHDLDFVRQIADQAHVLDFGQVIASGDLADVLADPAVRRAYVGTGEHA